MEHDPNRTQNMSRAKQVGMEEQPDRFPEPRAEDYASRARDRARFEGILAGVGALDELGSRARGILEKQPAGEFASFAELLRAVLPEEVVRREEIAGGLRLHPTTLEALRDGYLEVTEVDPEPIVLLAFSIGLSAEQLTALVTSDLERDPWLGAAGDTLEVFARIWPGSE